MDELPLALPRPRGLFGPLLELIARRVRAEVESELANFNLRPRHVIALTVLDVLGEPSQSALAESLRIDRTNLVGLLNELEAAHLIERRRSGEGRRRHIVALTAVGARRLDEIQDGLAEAESRVFASLDSEQQATLYALLEQATADAVALPAELSPPTPDRTRHTNVFPEAVAIAGDRMAVGAGVSTRGMVRPESFTNRRAECRRR